MLLFEGEVCFQNMEEKRQRGGGKYHMLKIEKRCNTDSW